MKKRITNPVYLMSSLATLISMNVGAKGNMNLETPNIVMILADDMGYGDAGFLGAKDVRTPNIDALANGGVVFTQGYVSASVCGPSRCGLLTGVYQQRYGMGENTPGSKWLTGEFPMQGIPTSQPLVSELLKQKGYKSKAIGKWHVGLDVSLRPLQRGFDEFYGFLNGSHDYYKADTIFGKKKGFWPMFRDNDIVKYEGYTTEVFTREAVDFILRAGEEPFFVYLSYNAVHHPWQVPQKYINRLSHIKNKDRRKFAGMLLAMDDGVGEVVQALKKKGILENTIVIFLADNGSPRGQSGHMSNTGGYRGWKGDTYEGGIRVPFIINWPNKLPKGMVYSPPVSTLDIVPTLAAFLGINRDDHGFPFDGINILPYLTGEKDKNQSPHDILYWRRDNDYAIRMGDWKLTWNDGDKTKRPMLFNLGEDKFEKTDLIQDYPKKAKQLQKLFDNWDCKLPDSKYWGGPNNRKRK